MRRSLLAKKISVLCPCLLLLEIDEALLVILRDLLSGAAETVGSTLEYAILQISLNPSVQEGIQAEIDRAVGPSRRPLYSDRNRFTYSLWQTSLIFKFYHLEFFFSMPYTQATILESLRLGSLLSPGERIAVEENTIDGVFYPKVFQTNALSKAN